MKQIKITYTNHLDQVADLVVVPKTIWFGSTNNHQSEQWFLKVQDVDQNLERDLALVNVKEMTKIIEDITTLTEATAVVQPTTAITKAKLYADGGSRGNPGPSALGYAILDLEDNVVKKQGKYLGITTNNQAEYQALQAGLRDALDSGVTDLQVYMDSLLVINQTQGIWKIKNPDFLPIVSDIHQLLQQFDHVTLAHVPRALNKIADAAVNECLDAQ